MQTVSSMWTAEKLGLMEQLSIKSYLYHGVPYHLYLYKNVPDIPAGVVVHDANEILIEREVEKFRHPQQFADHFRYGMLLKNGGWHADLDSVCLKPFDIATPYAFVQDNIDEFFLAGSFMKAPRGSRIMQFCFDAINDMSTEARVGAGYLDVGPRLVHRAVTEFKMERYVQPKIAFDPVPWNRIRDIVNPEVEWDLSKSYAVHLRNSIWDGGPNAGAGTLVNGKTLMSEEIYPAGCLYEVMKRKYL